MVCTKANVRFKTPARSSPKTCNLYCLIKYLPTSFSLSSQAHNIDVLSAGIQKHMCRSRIHVVANKAKSTISFKQDADCI